MPQMVVPKSSRGQFIFSGWNAVGTRLARGWNAVGTRLARGWNAVGTRLARGCEVFLTFEGPMSCTLRMKFLNVFLFGSSHSCVTCNFQAMLF